MIRGLTHWSVRAYPLLLHVYPPDFRREFGPSMAQAFNDLARDLGDHPRFDRVLAFWMRTIADVVVSLVTAYAESRRELVSRSTLAAAVSYAVVLVAIVGYGAFTFGEFYAPPAFTVAGGPADATEPALVQAHQQALSGDLGRYQTFMGAAGFVLAIGLGLTAALFGLWHKSLLHGAAALAAGTMLTVGLLELLPAIWFPFDRYSPAFVWLIARWPMALAAWAVVLASGAIVRHRRQLAAV